MPTEKWTPQHPDYNLVLSATGIKVIEEKFPNGEVRVFREDELVKKFQKDLGGKERALAFANGMVVEREESGY